MSKNDFEALANVAACVRGSMKSVAFIELVDHLCEVCEKANARFNRATFKAACYK